MRRAGYFGGIAALAVISASAVGLTPATADSYSTPSPVASVEAAVLKHGIAVSWVPGVATNPATTNYVVSAGPDSCPVTVKAGTTSAVLPFITGPTVVTPVVQAVNAYGISSPTAGPTLGVSGNGTPGLRNVQFLEFSDFHGALEKSTTSIGAAVLTSAFAADRKTVASTFTVSAGDNIGASPVISSAFDDKPTLAALNLMDVDVSTLGNHEHDQPLPELRAAIDATDFPWVVSNYDTVQPLQGTHNSAQEMVIVDRAGIKVGFVGMNLPDVAQEVRPGNLNFGRDGRRIITVWGGLRGVQRQVDRARAAGAQLVVALVHEGWEVNSGGQAIGPIIDIAGQLRGVDLVFGAHTHQLYASYVHGRPVVEVPNSGQAYSRTLVCLDTRTGKVRGSSVQIVAKQDVAGIVDDPTVAALVADYRQQLGPVMDARVGAVSGLFPRGGTPPVERSGETPMGDFAADAMRAAFGTDFALLNGGSIRDTLPARQYQPIDPTLRRPGPGTSGPYDVTLGDVQTVFPFGNMAATTTVTGANLWAALEHGVSGYPVEGRFPQVSGLRFVFDPTRPVGSRVISVTKPDGTPIAADQSVYTITTVDYLVYGGDGYGNVFSPTSAQIKRPYLDIVVAALKADQAAGVVTPVPPSDGRIRVLAPASP